MIGPLEQLTRVLHRRTREWGEDIAPTRGIVNEISGFVGGRSDQGTEPYLLSFRVWINDPVHGCRREFTVTVTESKVER